MASLAVHLLEILFVFLLLLQWAVIPTTKQSNKKLDSSMGKVFIQRDKPENTHKKLIVIKYILNKQ